MAHFHLGPVIPLQLGTLILEGQVKTSHLLYTSLSSVIGESKMAAPKEERVRVAVRVRPFISFF